MYAFVVQALTATAFTVNPVSLGATSLITAIAMLNAFTIPNPLATDANAKRVLLAVESPVGHLNPVSITKAFVMRMPYVRGTLRVTMAAVVAKVSEAMVINAKLYLNTMANSY